MKTAVVQLNYTVGDFESNKFKIVSSIKKAKNDGADLVVFAEQAISGTPAYDLLNKVTFLELGEDALVEIAAASDNISVIVGLPIQHINKTVSAAALIQNRKVIRYITKKNISSRDEMGHISHGKGCEYATVKGEKIAIAIGDDINSNDEYYRDVNTIVVIAADRYGLAKIEKRYDYLSRKAYVEGKNLIFVNQVGGQTDVIYDGSSAVFNSKGEAVALLKNFDEDMVMVDFEANNPPVEVPYQHKIANVYKAIKLGLKDFFEKNGYTKACLGLSGGIDSAVVVALAAEVLGAENVKVLMLPSKFSSDHSVDDAVKMADGLGLQYDVIPITEAYESIVGSLKPVFGLTQFDVTEENIQARLRCVMMMAVSNKFGHILLNTSNKSELALGYGTLYGDNTGVVSVIGDLYKGDVFELARYINRNSEIIPEAIIDKEPSAELRPEQKDVDYLGPYDMVDAVLYRMIEEGQHREEIINAGFDAKTVQRIYEMILRNEQKRYQFCPTFRLSTCPFVTERVMPITSKYGF